jgi:hypothetical protein
MLQICALSDPQAIFQTRSVLLHILLCVHACGCLGPKQPLPTTLSPFLNLMAPCWCTVFIQRYEGYISQVSLTQLPSFIFPSTLSVPSSR